MKCLKPIIVFLLFVACNESIKYPEGGYDYPKHVGDKDTNFYYYPVKDLFSKKDSLSYSVEYLNLHEFDEPNLSLKFLGNDIFRFQYSAPLGGFYIIIINKNSILIKKPIYGGEREFDEDRLSETEKEVYRIISDCYPYTNLRGYKKRFVDSINAINPKLLQPENFLYLTNKTFKYIEPAKAYTTTTIKISDDKFKQIIASINQSGYWKMPFVFDCKNNFSTDGYTCILEANTKNKYNFVHISTCDDSSTERSNFLKLCQEFIDYGGLEKEIYVWGKQDNIDTTNTLIDSIPEVPLKRN